MATQKQIEQALNTKLAEYLGAYPIDVVYPAGPPYTPVEGTDFLQIDYLHGETSQVEIGTTSDDRATGIYQITLNVGNAEGSAKAMTLISQLKEYFKRGTIATYNGLNVRITQFYLGGYTSEGDWYREVINIVFRADLDN